MSNILKGLMAELGINESELARRTGIGQPVVHRICSGETDNPKVATLSPIANFFAISISQLIGDEPLPTDRIAGTFNPEAQGWRQIPLLEWEQVLSWPNLSQKSAPLPAISTDIELSQHAYALAVRDTTMEPRFPEGTVLIVDPNLKPNNLDFAIIHVEGHDLPNFKQILIDGGHTILKPLNSDFKTLLLDKPHKFLGVMIQSRMDFKKRK
ncbi:MAG: S24 family peptidase [Rickettsiella sp.]|nr:S24 family peptidase [Rickettsiella sp.]